MIYPGIQTGRAYAHPHALSQFSLQMLRWWCNVGDIAHEGHRITRKLPRHSRTTLFIVIQCAYLNQECCGHALAQNIVVLSNVLWALP
jgi:hypothetical protein